MEPWIRFYSVFCSFKKAKKSNIRASRFKAFFTSAVGVLHALIIALGTGLGIRGAFNLKDGNDNKNSGANACA